MAEGFIFPVISISSLCYVMIRKITFFFQNKHSKFVFSILIINYLSIRLFSEFY